MNKYLFFIVFSLISTQVFAATKIWTNLNQGSSYFLEKELKIADESTSFLIKVNSQLILKERAAMDMIKVELYKFDVSDHCSDSEMTTDIQLIDIIQSSGKAVTVGYDLAEGCILEIFVEFTDLNAKSLFR